MCQNDKGIILTKKGLHFVNANGLRNFRCDCNFDLECRNTCVYRLWSIFYQTKLKLFREELFFFFSTKAKFYLGQDSNINKQLQLVFDTLTSLDIITVLKIITNLKI